MLEKTFSRIRRFLASEDGPTAVEYSVMLALIVAVCIIAIQSVGTQTSSMYDGIASDMKEVQQTANGGL